MLAIYACIYYEIANLAALTGFAKMRSRSLGVWQTSGTAAPTNQKADLILAIYADLQWDRRSRFSTNRIFTTLLLLTCIWHIARNVMPTVLWRFQWNARFSSYNICIRIHILPVTSPRKIRKTIRILHSLGLVLSHHVFLLPSTTYADTWPRPIPWTNLCPQNDFFDILVVIYANFKELTSQNSTFTVDEYLTCPLAVTKHLSSADYFTYLLTRLTRCRWREIRYLRPPAKLLCLSVLSVPLNNFP